MNFLAHLFLSGNDEEVMLGNLLADFLKGKERKDFSEGIQKGIALHHKIDEFTDSHLIVEQSKIRLRPIFSHYSPVVSDVYFDHFLAANFNLYSSANLSKYTRNCYRILTNHHKIFPQNLRRFIAIMRFENLLVSYSTIEGMDVVFNRMAKRTKFNSNLEIASIELVKNYKLYEEEFFKFFPELIVFSNEELQKLS
ncbi:MAG: ACP phosphodiesterase [Bacteroidota bacterium]